jgi:hypothetical protein
MSFEVQACGQTTRSLPYWEREGVATDFNRQPMSRTSDSRAVRRGETVVYILEPGEYHKAEILDIYVTARNAGKPTLRLSVNSEMVEEPVPYFAGVRRIHCWCYPSELRGIQSIEEKKTVERAAVA